MRQARTATVTATGMNGDITIAIIRNATDGMIGTGQTRVQADTMRKIIIATINAIASAVSRAKTASIADAMGVSIAAAPMARPD